MNETPIQRIELGKLRAHPHNSNVMPERLLSKLAAHIERTGRYPPLIVRPAPEEPDAYQVLDGHHRWSALERLGHTVASCIVWEADDEQALTLVATLNRLRGDDDPKQRSSLLSELQQRCGASAEQLAELLPETRRQVRHLLDLQQPPPEPAPPRPLEEMPASVHFFLTGAQKHRLDRALRRLGGGREEALMRLVEQFERAEEASG